MKKSLIATMLITSIALSSTAFAADGIIHFTGKVVDNVCNVTPTLNVNMGDVAVDQLDRVGALSTEEKFELVLTDCPATLTTVRVQLDGTQDADDISLFQLDNSGQSGNASGVALEIRDASASLIAPGGESHAAPLITGTNALPFSAAYRVTTNKVTAGDANVSVQFSVLYN